MEISLPCDDKSDSYRSFSFSFYSFVMVLTVA